jgi:site-specific DNA-methyltransferase (adenine-specific)
MARTPLIGAPPADFQLVHGDATALLASLPTGCIHLGITDPAYESLEEHRAKGTTTRLKKSAASSNEWFAIFGNSRYPEWFQAWYRVLARDAHLYVYCDLPTARIIEPIGEMAGFKFWNEITWDKRKIGMGYHYRRRKELIVFFEKGKRKLLNLGTADVLDDMADDVQRAEHSARMGVYGVDMISEERVRDGYPTEKPVKVSDVLVQQSSVAGELVLDTFMGSGSVGEAALRNGRRFMGGDLNPQSIELARRRFSRWREGLVIR